MPEPRDVEPTWINADQNPFHLRIFDCRPFTRDFVSTTRDPGLAKTFAKLRHSDGRDRRGRMPASATGVSCNLVYKLAKDTRDGVIFRAREMEDKWDMDLFGDSFYFSRSWTGDLVFVADARHNRGALTISRVNASVANPDEVTSCIRDVDFLIKTYLFNREVPHSLPPGLPSTERAIVVYSISVFGKAASFATYDDTLSVSI